MTLVYNKPSPAKNAFYAQSGGMTAVINATASGVISEIRKHPKIFKTLYAGKNGILGAIQEQLHDTRSLSKLDLEHLYQTPGGAFGSCRYKMKKISDNPTAYAKILETFRKYNIGYFFYNGGNDSQDTALQISEYCRQHQYPISVIGIPKTIDNDLVETDSCPGFGSVAKYIAVSTQEAALDVISMAETSTKVFILEVMGRHAGWIAAASALGKNHPTAAPHLILFPEIPFSAEKFCQAVQNIVEKKGFCVIVASEGIKTESGEFLSEAGTRDDFGHTQLGGVAPKLAQLIKQQLNYKYHWAVSDYLQRAARHLASQTDLDQAYELGKYAVHLAVSGKTDLMASIVRISDPPNYQWKTDSVALEKVANHEKKLPREWITADGWNITEAAEKYLRPLILGEAYPSYNPKTGLPNYFKIKN